MRVAYIDFETFWSQDHSLSKMNPIAYVMHRETEIISCAIAIDDYPVDVIFGEAKIAHALHKLDWSDTLAIAHNMSGFDAMILAWRLGIRPKMWGCTLAMARPIHAKKPGLALGKLVEHYGIGVKDNTALVNTKGRHLKDFTPEEIEAMRVYNTDDTTQCRALFKKLKKHFNAKELWQIDNTIRMLVEPKFVVDTELLEATLVKERERKHNVVIELADMMGIDIEGDVGGVEEQVTEHLASASKFGAILLNRGVGVPMKPSPSDPENKMVPALAKTDQAFLDLQQHPDPVVAQAACARLAIKSTILESRILDFLAAADATKGLLPVPLNVYGADTTGRWSGWGYNPQNLPRIIEGKPKLTDALRNCMCAPDGYVVGVADLSGIELRVNMFLWKVAYAMKLFQDSPDKADLYRYFAANGLYDVPESEVTKNQRQVGKVCLAENSLILTRKTGVVSWTKIQNYTPDMELWDGEEWVWAQGVVSNGWRPTQKLCGLSLTPDHLVLCGTEWLEAQSVRGAEVARALATGAANLSLRDMLQATAAVSPRLLLSATAGFLSTRLKQTTSRLLKRPGATSAQSRPLDENGTGSTLRQCPKTITAPGSSTDFPLPLHAATTRRIVRTITTAVEGSRSALNGAMTALRSWFTQEPCPAGIPQKMTWTASMWTKGTSQGTSGSSPPERTEGPTSEPSGNSSSASLSWKRVYDITNSGPRNRFTALTQQGPIIVHNCHLGLGFGAGGATFQRVAKMMGGVDMDLGEATDVVEAYRAAHPEIVKGWKTCHSMLNVIKDGSKVAIDPWELTWTGPEGIYLPSGRVIRYPDLRCETDESGKSEWWYGQGRHKARIYAGKIDENIVQALARDVIADNALAFFKQTGYRASLMVHDELVYLFPKDEAKDLLGKLQAQMRTPPSWWPELVTWSEGDIALTYGAAK